MDKKLFYYNIEKDFIFDHTLSKEAPLIPIHIHNLYEIYYFISGDITYYVEGQGYSINSNDILIMNNKELHKPVFHSDKPYERITIHFLPSFISSFLTKDYNPLYCFEQRPVGHYNKLSSENIDKFGIVNYFEKIKHNASLNKPESILMIKTLFIQMLIQLNSISKQNKESLSPSLKLEYDNIIIRDILDYINKNLHRKITLDYLSEKFFISKSYLCYLFKLNTGFTVMEYIASKRVMNAKELLLSGTSALEACHAVGFNDYSNFYKTFFRLVGLSPKKYLKSYNESNNINTLFNSVSDQKNC